MENYQKVYHKLFNTITDLTAQAQIIISKMEVAQAECEEMILDSGTEEESRAD